MLLRFAGALMYVEQRRQLVVVFPQSLRHWWTEWELRILILISLALQVVLVLLGNRRKHIAKTRIRIALWSAYLMADWVAIVALGVISRNAEQYDCSKAGDRGSNDSINELETFWAPFLLLHLGGPDTITAYSMEDNELWLRHLLGLVIQSGVTVYIFLIAWPGSTWLPLLSLLILDAGIIKYGERTCALRSANNKHFRDSMLTPPDPGPSYSKFMDEFTLKKAEGFYVGADEVIENQVQPENSYPAGRGKLISEAYDLFQTFKRLFVDLILSFEDRDNSSPYFQHLTPEQAFDVIEVELGFAFDVLYTKAPVTYTLGGCMLRLFCFSCTSVVSLAFVLLCDKSIYHKIDLVITYLLLGLAILLDIYAVLILLRSDWTDHWLMKHNRTREFLIIPCLREPKKLRWSNSMAQYNLLSVCLRDKPAVCYRIQRLLHIDEFRENHRYKTYCKVSKELKDLIFSHFKKYTGSSADSTTALCTRRGSFALKELNALPLDWTTKVEFDQSILIWHIATDLCYYLDRCENPEKEVSPNCTESKNISDYMLYLLVLCPFMLPIGIGMIRFRDTCAEATDFFQERSPIKDKAEACYKLLQVNTEVSPATVKGDRSKSVLFDACILAKSLRANDSAKGKEEKWEIVSRVWVEILAYAATHCRGNHHAQQLRKGGELLTHVWLLMAHLGITEQLQISQGHKRAKLVVK